MVTDLEHIVGLLPYPTISAILMGSEMPLEGYTENEFYAALAVRLNELKERDDGLLKSHDGTTATLSGKELLGVRGLYLSMGINSGSVDLGEVISFMRAIPKLPRDLQSYLDFPQPLLQIARQVASDLISPGYGGNPIGPHYLSLPHHN